MFQRWWVMWPLFAAIMGFALGGSFVWGVLYVPPEQYAAHNQQVHNGPAQQEHKNGFWEKASDDPVAYFTLWLVAFTGVLAISTIGLWIVTWRASVAQARDMKASIDVSERALVAGERAWVRVDVQNNGDLVFQENGDARIYLVFILTNTGNSPATKVRVNPHTFLANFNPSAPRDEYRKICVVTRMRGDMPIDEMLSYTLFPGETKKIPHFETISNQQIGDLMQVWKDRTGNEWKHFTPNIVGCISYSIPFDDRQHQTGFMYELRRRLPGQTPALQWGMFNTDERTVPASEMQLFHSVWGSPSID